MLSKCDRYILYRCCMMEYSNFPSWNKILYPSQDNIMLSLLHHPLHQDDVHMTVCAGINRIYHRSLMQTEKSQPKGKQIMPETRVTEFTALSVYPRVGISRSASETDD